MNPNEFDRIIQIRSVSTTIDSATGQPGPTPTYSVEWEGYAKELNPLRGREKIEGDQEVGIDFREFAIRNEGQTLDKTMHIYVDSKIYELYRIDNFRGGRNYLVVGGENRDNVS